MDAHVPIHRAQPEDADRLTQIALAAKRHWGYPELWIEAWTDSLTLTAEFISAHLVFAAVGPDGVPVAFYALRGTEGDVQLEHLWVSPGQIRQGLGRRLFEHARDTALALGASALLIDSDPNAEPFYETMGAQRAGTLRADVCGTRRSLPQLRYALR